MFHFFFATHLPHSSLVRQVLFSIYTCFKNIHAGDSRQMRPSRCKTGASVRWASMHTHTQTFSKQNCVCCACVCWSWRAYTDRFVDQRKNLMYKKRSSKGNRFFFTLLKKCIRGDCWIFVKSEGFFLCVICVCAVHSLVIHGRFTDRHHRRRAYRTCQRFIVW